LLISDRAQVPALSRIENSGNTKILVDAPQLSDLQNTQSGHLQIETH
jgi:hypothetical protein